MKYKTLHQPRRRFLRTCLALPATYLLAACAEQTQPVAIPAVPSPSAGPPTAPPVAPTTMPTSAPATALPSTSTAVPPTIAQVLVPTPACGDDDDDPTPAQTEGPYFTPNTPARTSLLEPNMPGTRLIVSGLVLTTDCQPVAQALIDVWQADDSGAYDNVGYRLRGHQFTDANGRYNLETIMPGLYPGRTRHIHIKVQAPNQPVLTTQLYFPNEPANQRDGIFQQELVMALQETADGRSGSFDFVLQLA